MIVSEVICAIASPQGIGGVSIIRISGDKSMEVVDNIVKLKGGKNIIDLKPNTMTFGYVYDGDHLIDEVMLTSFHCPQSFTGENSVEIYCHGSIYIQNEILKLLICKGARLAKNGEFTQRAFINNKIDLASAEGIYDLIESSSATAHKIAINQMRGGISKDLSKLRKKLLNISSLLELELDFSEEDVEFADRKELINIANDIHSHISNLCKSFAVGNAIKNGIPTVIVGNTNVGKSTLLNNILKDERAIVSDIAGTTRDTIEETIVIDGIKFRFIDTAGLRETEDKIEKIGIDRAIEKIKEATIILLMLDINSDINEITSYYERVKQQQSDGSKLHIILNKIDTYNNFEIKYEAIKQKLKNESIIGISAKQSINIDKLILSITSFIDKEAISSETPIISNLRHYEALTKANEHIENILLGLSTNIGNELIAMDAHACNHYIGEITGEISSGDILQNIFSKFCIGK